MFEIKWEKRVLLPITWNHRKWHVHRNPGKRKAAAQINQRDAHRREVAALGVAIGLYPKTGE